MMNPPNGERDDSTNSVNLQWQATSAPRDGGSAVLTYVLQFTKDVAGDWTTLLGDGTAANVAPQTQVDYTHTSVGNDRLYYRIAAKNRWGTGMFSKPNFMIDVAQQPD
jgi:hypothetical protein